MLHTELSYWVVLTTKKIISSQLNLFLINNRMISCYCVHAKEIAEGYLRVADEGAHVLED